MGNASSPPLAAPGSSPYAPAMQNLHMPPPFSSPPPADPVAAQERTRKAFDAYREVFGDDPRGAEAGWIYRSSNEFEPWSRPARVAEASEEGLQRVLARLKELSATVVPNWMPKLKRQRVRVFKPRR